MKNKISIHPDDVKKGKISTYNFGNLKMTFCTAPNNRGRVKIINYFDGCRETVAGFVRGQIEAEGTKNLASRGDPEKIDLKKARILLYTKANDALTTKSINNFSKRKDNEIATSLRLINHYERRTKWLLTKITKIDINKTFDDYLKSGEIKGHGYFTTKNRQNVCDTINMYMVVGTNKWMKSPHMLSLYLLMLRLGNSGFKSNFKTHEELIKDLEEFSSKVRYKDTSHIRDTLKMWDIIFENYNKIFKNRTLNRLYNSKYLVNSCSGFNEGITRLCTGFSRDHGISMKFIDICKLNKVDLKYRVKIQKKKRR